MLYFCRALGVCYEGILYYNVQTGYYECELNFESFIPTSVILIIKLLITECGHFTNQLYIVFYASDEMKGVNTARKY